MFTVFIVFDMACHRGFILKKIIGLNNYQRIEIEI